MGAAVGATLEAAFPKRWPANRSCMPRVAVLVWAKALASATTGVLGGGKNAPSPLRHAVGE